MSFDNLFFHYSSRTHLYMEYPFGYLHGRTYLAQLSSKNRRTEADFHLNNRLNVPLNLKEN